MWICIVKIFSRVQMKLLTLTLGCTVGWGGGGGGGGEWGGSGF